MPHTMRVEPDSAIASGDVGWVRIIGAHGRAIADSVVSKKDGPGWITFNTLAFRKGGPVSFFGRMAVFSQKPIDDDDVTASIHGSDAVEKRTRELHRKWHESELQRRRRVGQTYSDPESFGSDAEIFTPARKFKFGRFTYGRKRHPKLTHP